LEFSSFLVSRALAGKLGSETGRILTRFSGLFRPNRIKRINPTMTQEPLTMTAVVKECDKGTKEPQISVYTKLVYMGLMVSQDTFFKILTTLSVKINKRSSEEIAFWAHSSVLTSSTKV